MISNLKQALRVTPIHKDGDINNYRPISVLPVLSKIIESAELYIFFLLIIIFQTLVNLASDPITLLPLHSDVSDYILQNMDQGLVTGALFLVLKKAFDIVNYDILLKKLHNYGVTGNTLNWFKSYLSGRMQAVNVNSTLSEKK